MKSELTNAWAIVIAFWVILAYLVSGAPWLQLPFVFLYQIGLALGGFVLGWLWMFMFRTGGATISRETLAERDDLHGTLATSRVGEFLRNRDHSFAGFCFSFQEAGVETILVDIT